MYVAKSATVLVFTRVAALVSLINCQKREYITIKYARIVKIWSKFTNGDKKEVKRGIYIRKLYDIMKELRFIC